MKSLTPILMLVGSNVFMTIAWYGHLRHKGSWLPWVILVSWGIAFFEYCLQVPANRMGSNYYTAAQLKIIQEVITLAVFVVFSWLYLKQPPRTNEWIAMMLVMAAAVVANWPSKAISQPQPATDQGSMENRAVSPAPLSMETDNSTGPDQVAGNAAAGNVVAGTDVGPDVAEGTGPEAGDKTH